jgi:hypothetical protein
VYYKCIDTLNKTIDNLYKFNLKFNKNNNIIKQYNDKLNNIVTEIREQIFSPLNQNIIASLNSSVVTSGTGGPGEILPQFDILKNYGFSTENGKSIEESFSKISHIIVSMTNSSGVNLMNNMIYVEKINNFMNFNTNGSISRSGHKLSGFFNTVCPKIFFQNNTDSIRNINSIFAEEKYININEQFNYPQDKFSIDLSFNDIKNEFTKNPLLIDFFNRIITDQRPLNTDNILLLISNNIFGTNNNSCLVDTDKINGYINYLLQLFYFMFKNSSSNTNKNMYIYVKFIKLLIDICIRTRENLKTIISTIPSDQIDRKNLFTFKTKILTSIARELSLVLNSLVQGYRIDIGEIISPIENFGSLSNIKEDISDYIYKYKKVETNKKYFWIVLLILIIILLFKYRTV